MARAQKKPLMVAAVAESEPLAQTIQKNRPTKKRTKTKQENISYFSVKKNQDTDIFGMFFAANNKKDVDDWFEDDKKFRSLRASLIKNKKQTANLAEKPDPAKLIEKTMLKFMSSIASYELTNRISTTSIAILRENFIEKEIYSNKALNSTKLNESDNGGVFGIQISSVGEFDKKISKLLEYYRAGEVVPGAILLSIVATFDSFISDITRILLQNKSEKLFSLDRQFSFKEILAAKDFSDLQQNVIDDEIDQMMRGSHDEQIKSASI